ncbi:MAG: hypothetical protein JOZ31_18295 [Verrucomicrobia bacterium]|nr:hypothetical protein [Verrucomicrobiota bacterium]
MCLATNTKQIRRIPLVIASAHGIEKAGAILAVLARKLDHDPGNRRRRWRAGSAPQYWASGSVVSFTRITRPTARAA